MLRQTRVRPLATIPSRPPNARFEVARFGPDGIVDGRSWSQPNGWADVFVTLDGDGSFHKPAVLRQLFFEWTDDGAK